MLEIRLLGSPVVTVDGAPIDVDTRKAIALLAYLAIEHSGDREALAALFWADSSPERARATLRRTLSALRSGIGADALAADRQKVTLIDGFWCDVARFEALIGETGTHGHDVDDVCVRCIGPLGEAVSLYRDDFLGSFNVRDAPDFEDWARTIAESMRIRAGETYERLAMAHAANGDYPAAIETAGKWISLDELHEPAHRQLMLLHAWAGDRAGAMQAYRDCVAILDRELGVAPLEQTTELYEAILDEDLPPAPALRRPPRTVRARAVASAPDMIDRTDAMASLTEDLAAAASTARTCLITGDSWMGKTRLIEFISVEAESQGVGVVQARAFRAESQLPYGVASQLLPSLIESLRSRDIDIPDWALSELARIDPRLGSGQQPASPERQGQLRLAEAFLNLINAAGHSVPLLIAIDDLQWVDPASAFLLAYIQRRLNGPVLLILSTRTVDALTAPLDDIALGSDVTELHLAPLTPEDLSDHDVVEMTKVIDATGGVPILVKEAMESGISPGSANLVRYMESRRSRLSDLSRQVLAAAAVLNGMCDATLLRDTSGRTDDEVVEAVEELVEAGLLREESDGMLRFALDALETVAYDATSLIRRRLLHRRAADALASRSRTSSDARLAAATARHTRDGGLDDAADWYRLAGDLARSVFANDEAVASYEMAIALGHPEPGRLHLELGELAMARGDYQTATRELHTAAAHSGGSDLALVEHRMGDLNRILGRFELAEESFSRARSEHPDPGELLVDWALLRHRTGDPDGALAFAEEALRYAENADDGTALARAVNILGVVTPDADAAMKHLDRALEMAGSDDPARMAALNNKAHLLAAGGNVDEAEGLVEEAIDIAARSGYRHHQAALLNHLADLEHQAGRVGRAEELLTEAVTIFADIVAGDWEPEVWLLREW